jgi:hypothetical protein
MLAEGTWKETIYEVAIYPFRRIKHSNPQVSSLYFNKNKHTGASEGPVHENYSNNK